MEALGFARFEKLNKAMESTRSGRFSAPVLPLNCNSLHRSLSPASHSYSSRNSSSSRSASISSPSSVLKFSAHNSLSPSRNSVAHLSGNLLPPRAWNSKMPATPKKACMCSPTNHPGSFRCSLHRNSPPPSSSASTNSQLHMRRSAMKNSLVRIGSVEGEWVKRALTSLIRPSNHQIRRRMSFQPLPSRLRHMITAQDIPS